MLRTPSPFPSFTTSTSGIQVPTQHPFWNRYPGGTRQAWNRNPTDGSSPDSAPPISASSTSPNQLRQSRSHTAYDRHHVNVSPNGNHDGALGEPNPIAWSIGQFPRSSLDRNRPIAVSGSGTFNVFVECIDWFETYRGASRNKVAGAGVLGWHWADVSLANTRSVVLFSSRGLDGVHIESCSILMWTLRHSIGHSGK